MHSIKLSGYTMGVKFDKDLLTLEQYNYTTKIVTAYIVYDLDDGPKIKHFISDLRIPHSEQLV